MSQRLFPVAALVVVHGLLAFLVAVFAAMALADDGPSRLGSLGISLAALLVWVAAIRATLVPRRPLTGSAGGPLRAEAPVLVVAPLVAGWLLVVASVLVWAALAVTDLGSLDNPGWALVMTLGALGSLPDLVRLATGRLHRWRVEADDDAVRYQGWRTAVEVPWKHVTAVRLQERPAGVLVERRDGEPVLVPAIAFAGRPADLVERLEAIRRGRSRRLGH